MKLSQLFSLFPQLRWGEDPVQEVKGLTQDSRKVGPGTVFVAIRGHNQDGHQFIQEVCKAGALAVVLEEDSLVPKDFKGAVVKVSNSRVALDRLAARYFGEPAEKLFCVGVTGTNGKTSITYLVEHLLTQFGWPTGVMGTVNHRLGERVWSSELTTPDPVVLQKRLMEFKALSARAVAFEISSHALSQHRADQIPFDVGVFTNLTRDHLDYHKDMESYFHSKQRLFTEILRSSTKPQTYAVVNTDDPYGRKLQVANGVKYWSYGMGDSHFCFTISVQSFSRTHFSLRTPRGEAHIELPLPGLHNVYNATAAVAVALAAGMSLSGAAESLASFKGIPGRLEAVENKKGLHVFVDYAHTDDALRSVLQGLQSIRRQVQGKSRIITLFGCGGDRDRGKRPLMTQAAESLSDYVWVTSDNPRTEDPESIIQDCIKGLPEEVLGKKVFTEVDRRRAIEKALHFAQPGDVVLIAGKGHEDYQIIGKDKRPFHDASVVREILG